MDSSLLIELAKIFAGVAVGSGGIWTYMKLVAEKRKTPYDMLIQLLNEQKKFYEAKNADYEREKLASAEKSSVIMQSHFCQHKYKDPNVVCPVDVANDARLKNICDRCANKNDEDNCNDCT